MSKVDFEDRYSSITGIKRHVVTRSCRMREIQETRMARFCCVCGKVIPEGAKCFVARGHQIYIHPVCGHVEG